MPFLSIDCGIVVDDSYVSPLYKHCINIKYPTMAIIGLTNTAAITQMIDIQVGPGIAISTINENNWNLS